MLNKIKSNYLAHTSSVFFVSLVTFASSNGFEISMLTTLSESVYLQLTAGWAIIQSTVAQLKAVGDK